MKRFLDFFKKKKEEKPYMVMGDNNTKTEIIEYDIEKIKKGFSLWIDKWEHSLIEIEFNDPEERGIVTRTEDDDSLGYSFTTEFNFSIRKRKK